ncbi:MAG TPA: M43 family zinc metalloprotease, partial [Bacteroidia bacterium]
MKYIYTIFKASLILTVLLVNQRINAQALYKAPVNTNAGHCGSDFLLKSIDPLKLQNFEQALYNRSLLRGGSPLSDTDQFMIPVAFHIIHENSAENISDQQVWDAFHLLNNSFANEVPFDPAAGINTDISFCLSPGMISRHVSALTNINMETDDYAVKQIGVVDPEIYINIWVVNSINSLTMGPGVAGYAMMPAAHGGAVDGIVIEAAFINNNPDDVKVLVHEVGHYLGLYHTFEGGCTNNNCMTDGDRVCDTPPDNSIAPVQCSGSVNTCHTDADDASTNNPFRDVSLGGLGDQPDMFQNYMDYGFQSCQTKFTDGQRTRMRDVLRTTRHSLLEHPNYCMPCASPVTGTLTIPPTLPAGVPASFTVDGSDPSLFFLWVLNGQSLVGHTITPTFSEPVTVYITVYVLNLASPGCSLTLRDTVEFTCGVTQPTFAATPYGLTSPGQNITFITPDNGYTYTWNIDGVASGTGTTFNYTVTGDYGRLVTVTASNGTCQSTSASYYIDPNNCSSSKENNTWYFGTAAGINFNTNPPQAIQGKITTEEGCAVLSDAVTGAPIFHSDGVTVGNSQTGFTLQNGTGLTGHPSTTQSAMFVPMPGSNRYVYLFTIDCQAGDYTNVGGGIYYSIIDKQGNGGNGEVTLKNQLLVARVPEKVTAVKNMAGDGIWVISHLWNSDAFYAWEITSTGIGNPIISHVGSIHTSAPDPYSGAYALGELKASPSGKKLALAVQGRSYFEVFDFNNNTGIISNAMMLQNDDVHSNYGVTFSPNERFLYGNSIGPVNICRFDLTAGNAAAINASFTPIGTLDGSGGGSIQLAPDGKIYAARRGSYYLSVISNPNAINVADCGFLMNGFRLKDYTRSYYGLPNPVQSAVLSVKPAIIGPDKICLNTPSQSGHYSFDPIGNATYTWSHHGSNTFLFVNDSTATMTYTTPGKDTLIVTRTAACGSSYDTLFITTGTAPVFDIGADQLVCPGTSVIITAAAGMFDYMWNNGTNMQSNTVNVPGKVKVQVITQAGCVLKDSLMITYYSITDLNPASDTSICNSETLTLNAPSGMTSYLWSNGATSSSITVSDSGMYTVTVQNYGCTFKDSILVRKDVADDAISTDTIISCVTSPTFFSAPSGFDAYSWQLPSGSFMNTDTVSISDPGYYI